MGLFHYTGKDIRGKNVKGTIDADTKNEVIASLRRQGIFPTTVMAEEATGREINLSFGKKKVSSKELAIFCRQFQTITSAGIALVECLDILRKQTDNKMLKPVIDAMYEEVQKGVNLSAAMKKHRHVFPDMLVNMVAAGEYSGRLDSIMGRMMIHFEKEYKIQTKLKSALIYPIILVTFSVLVSLFLLVVIVPNFVSMFESFGVELPFLTQMFVNIGTVLKTFWYIPIALIVSITVMMKRSLGTAEGRLKFDGIKLNLPLFGPVNKKIATSRFARTLGTLLTSGISIIEAMEQVVKVVDNSAITESLNNAMERIKKGEGIAGPLSAVKAFPPMLISMIKIGEETGAMDELLVSTAEFYDDEVEVAINAMISMINPIIILIMAVVVGAIVLSIALPMFGMFDLIG